MKAVLPGNDTPYFEGLCDLNGEPLKEEPAADQTAEPAADQAAEQAKEVGVDEPATEGTD